MSGIGFGFSYSHITGLILFLILSWAVYWITLPGVFHVPEADDIPYVRELLHYSFFMVAVLFVIPVLMKIIVYASRKVGLSTKSQGQNMLSTVGADYPSTFSESVDPWGFGKRRR
jgi:hypothetical protein